MKAQTLEVPAGLKAGCRPSPRRPYLMVGITLMILSLVLPVGLQAGDVCHFTKVDGQVDLLKGGKNPPMPAKVQVGAEEKDAVHTQAAARAQLLFIDDTNLTIAPASRVTIESYMYDAKNVKRQAVTQVTQGMMQAVVTNLRQLKEPDFLIRTPTAIIGVRGTKANIIVSSDEQGQGVTILHVPEGLVLVRSSDPRIPGLATISGGYAVSVPAEQPPGAVLKVTEQVAKKINKLLESGVPPVLKGDINNPNEVLTTLVEGTPPEAGNLPPAGKVEPFQGQVESSGNR